MLRLWLLAIVIIFAVVIANNTHLPAITNGNGATETPTNTITPTETPTPSQTPSSTFTPTTTQTPAEAPTSTPTPTSTATATTTGTSTSVSTITPTPTNTATATTTGTPTETGVPTQTGTATSTPTQTVTATGTSTGTPTVTPTETPTETPTHTPTNTATSTSTATSTATSTSTTTPTLTPTATSTSDSTIFDDFNDNERDDSKWMVYDIGSGSIVTETGGKAVVTLLYTASETIDYDFFDGGYFSQCPLVGDFDIQVDYELVNWPVLSGVRVGLMVDKDQEGPKDLHVSRIGFGQNDGPSSPKEIYYDGINDITMVATDDMTGTLRITRADTVFVGYYREDDAWVPIAAAINTPDNLYFGFSIWSANYAFANQTAVVAFDNMVINQGDVVCP